MTSSSFLPVVVFAPHPTQRLLLPSLPKELSHGTHCSVHPVPGAASLAIKRYHLANDPRKLRSLQQELWLSHLFRHDSRATNHLNLIQHLAVHAAHQVADCRVKRAIGSVHQLLHDKSVHSRLVSREDRVRAVAHLFTALHSLHSKGVIHADVKPSNLLAHKDGTFSLCDFGSVVLHHVQRHRQQFNVSYRLEPGTPHGITSLRYAAPEMLDPALPYDEKVDIFAAGLTSLELLLGERSLLPTPRDAKEALRHLSRLFNDQSELNWDYVKRRWPSFRELPLNDQEEHFLSWCLHRDPEHRPTAAQVLALPLFEGLVPPSSPASSPPPSPPPPPPTARSDPLFSEMMADLAQLLRPAVFKSDHMVRALTATAWNLCRFLQLATDLEWCLKKCHGKNSSHFLLPIGLFLVLSRVYDRVNRVPPGVVALQAHLSAAQLWAAEVMGLEAHAGRHGVSLDLDRDPGNVLVEMLYCPWGSNPDFQWLRECCLCLLTAAAVGGGDSTFWATSAATVGSLVYFFSHAIVKGGGGGGVRTASDDNFSKASQQLMDLARELFLQTKKGIGQQLCRPSDELVRRAAIYFSN